MHRAFSKAYSLAEPDYVIFLGDLFDEGVPMSASSEQFEWTLKRFHDIFESGNQTNVRHLAICNALIFFV
jgi:DNA repair exonuclease SbcCD nuclease subunit